MHIIRIEGGQLKENVKKVRGGEVSCKKFVLRKVKEVVPKLFRQYYSINEAIKTEKETEEKKTEKERELKKFLDLYTCVLYRYLGSCAMVVRDVLKSEFYFLTKKLTALTGNEGRYIFDGKEFHCFNGEKSRREVGANLKCYARKGI